MFNLVVTFLLTLSGEWVKSNGDVIQAPCPSLEKFEKSTRLPAPCEALVPGFWLSVEAHKELAVELETKNAQVEELQKQIDELKKENARLQGDLLIKTAIPDCPPCVDRSTSSLVAGLLIGGVTIGGTAIWTCH